MGDRHDYRGSAAKQQTRLDTLRLVRKTPLLWNRQCKAGPCLACGWVEVCGEHDGTLRLLLDQGDVLRPGYGPYRAVNGPDSKPRDSAATKAKAEAKARAILAVNQQEYREATEKGLVTWHYGLLKDFLADPPVALDNTGVLVADGLCKMGKHRVADIQEPYIRFARQQKEKVGAFVLVLNLILRGGTGYTRDKALNQWRRQLPDLLGWRHVPQVPSEGFHVYRNNAPGPGWSMCLVRIRL